MIIQLSQNNTSNTSISTNRFGLKTLRPHHNPNGLFEDVDQPFLSLGRALHVTQGRYILCHSHSLFFLNSMLWFCISEILLCSNKDNRCPLPLVVAPQFGHSLR